MAVPQDKKLLAQRVKELQKDELFQHIIEGIRDDQTLVFLNPESSTEDREKAHDVVRGIAAIENSIKRIIDDAKVLDAKRR